jgi:hypothetical protein
MGVAETTDIEYDSIGRKVKETLSAGGTARALTQFSYDNDHRLTCTAVRMNPDVYGACRPPPARQAPRAATARIGSSTMSMTPTRGW